MLYNKNKYRKANDKKVLRKVGKQWKVMSVALLLAIGGAGVTTATQATNVNANASVRTSRRAKTHKGKKSKKHKSRKAKSMSNEMKALDQAASSKSLLAPTNSNFSDITNTIPVNYTNPSGADYINPLGSTKSKKTKKSKAKRNKGASELKNRINKNVAQINKSKKKKGHAKNTDDFGNFGHKMSNNEINSEASAMKNAGVAQSTINSVTSTERTPGFIKKGPTFGLGSNGEPSFAGNYHTEYNADGNAFTVPNNGINDDTLDTTNQSVSPDVQSKVNSLEANPAPNSSADNYAQEASLTNASVSASEAVSVSNSLASQSASNSTRNASVASAQASQAQAQNAASASASASTSTKNASIASASASASASTSAKNASLSASASASASQSISSANFANSIKAEIQSLDAIPSVPNATSATSTKSATAKSTAKTPSASNAQVNYNKGDNGSAASYHAKAVSDQAIYNNAQAKAQKLVNSLNGNPSAKALKGALAKASAKAKNDQSLATSYANTANQKNYAQKVSDIANAHHVTNSFYAQSVGYNERKNNKAVSQGADLANQLNTINSYAKKINNINANSAVSGDAKVKAASASANAQTVLNKLNDAKNSLNAIKASNASISQNNSAYINASVANEIAKINSQADNNFVNSLSTSLNNASATHAIIQSNAENFDNKAQNLQVNFRNASNVAVPMTARPGTSLQRVLSDTNAMTVFGNYAAQSALNTNDAQNAVNSLSDKYASASSEAKVDNVLGNNPTLDNVMATAGDYSKGMALVNGQNSDQINDLATTTSKKLLHAKSASDAYVKDTKADVVLAPSLAKRYSSNAQADQTNVTSAHNDLSNYYSQYTGMENASVASAKKALDHDSQFAQSYGKHVYNVAPKYVTAKKGMYVHSTIAFSHKDHVAPVHKGDELRVTAVGFAKNGATRYAVQGYRETHAKKGFVTAYPTFAQNTYLFADKGNHVNVTVLKGLRESTKPTYTKKSIVKTHKAGEKLSGRVVSEDGQYGGFTRIQLNNGHFITANTKYVKVNHAKHVHKHASNGLPKGTVNFWK